MTEARPVATDEDLSLAPHLPEGVRCLGVLSGKGGVGKSLVTGLLAVAFTRKAHPVGILDADLTGPSIPRMFGVRHAEAAEGERLAPARTGHLGIRIMSLNLLMEREDDPVIWRGPLVAKTVEQFVTDVDWDGVRYVVAWDSPMRPRDRKAFNYEALFLRTFAPDGAPQGDDVVVVSDPASPAWRPAVASDGKGTTLVAYERHPKTPNVPIRIGFRMLK